MKKILFLCMIILLAGNCFASKTWLIQDNYADVADSTWLIYIRDGAIVDSAHRVGYDHQSFDTALTIAEGYRHEAIIHAWFDGGDSAVGSSPFVYDLSMFSLAINAYASEDSANKAGHYLALAGDTSLWADATPITDTINAIIDTLQNQDNWVSSLTEDSNIGVDLDDVSGTLDASEIGSDAITNSKIAADAIGASEIAANAITTSEFADGTITAGKIATDAITATKIATGAIGADEIAASAITSSELADNAITAAKIATDAIGAAEIAASAIGADEIAADAIGTSEIAADAIGASEIAADAITSSELATTAVTEIEAAVYANRADYRATGFSTHSATDVWNVLYATAFTAGSMGDSLNNASYVQGSASLTASDIWNVPFGTGFDAGSIGDSLNNPSYVQGSASLTAADIWSYATRNLTSFGFDIDSTMFANNTFPVWLFTTEFFDSAQGSASGLTATDIWNVAFNTAFTAGTMGDSLTNTTFVQGSAAGLSASDIWAYASRSLTAFGTGLPTQVADTAYAKFIAGTNEDQFKADVSALALAVSVTAVLDSLGKSLDTLYAIIDTLQSQDGWIASQSDMTKSLDSLGKIIDSIETNSAQVKLIKDSTFAILDSVQKYLDVAVSTVTGSWSTVQRDSVLAALTNASLLAKIWNISFATAFTAGSVGDSLTTPAYVQGSAAGLTAADIWAYATRTINGGWVDSNKTEQGGSAGGDGAYSYTAVIIDTTSGATSPVADAPCFVNNAAQSAVPYFSLTNANGAATFNLDGGTWVIIMNKAGYASILDTITTTGIDTDTFYTYTSQANKTVVYGTLYDARGQYAANGRVKFQAFPYPGDSLIYKGDSLVMQTVVEDTANALGYFAIPIIANANYTKPDSTYYKVTVYDRYNRMIERPFYCIVPDTTSIALQSLTRWR